MSKKEKDQQPREEQAVEETPQAEAPQASTEGPAPQEDRVDEAERWKAAVAEQEDKFLRLCAEYDNFRKRTQKEKESIYADATAKAVSALLPVYDNLERALKQETADDAYKKGVEMTMGQLREVLSKLGIEEIPALGERFDPNLHNAVMHVEDEQAGENTIVEVFQAGFRTGEKVIRFAVVKVAN